jgi:hypothetical protein
MGRPFLVAGHPVTAETRAGGESGSWRVDLAPRVDGLTAEVRAALAEAWLRDALAEHASIASFARSALELMALGAPASLIEATHRAALDETRHAKMCFSLASAYAGRDLGPGLFPFGGSMEISSDAARVVARVAVEGCIGETLAAVQASEQLAAASDPAVRAVLRVIADDEARHAELAWRIVAWALRGGDAAVRDAVADAFAGSATRFPIADEIPSRLHETMAAHGRLGGAAIRGVLASAVAEIVAPAGRIMVG